MQRETNNEIIPTLIIDLLDLTLLPAVQHFHFNINQLLQVI